MAQIVSQIPLLLVITRAELVKSGKNTLQNALNNQLKKHLCFFLWGRRISLQRKKLLEHTPFQKLFQKSETEILIELMAETIKIRFLADIFRNKKGKLLI